MSNVNMLETILLLFMGASFFMGSILSFIKGIPMVYIKDNRKIKDRNKLIKSISFLSLLVSSIFIIFKGILFYLNIKIEIYFSIAVWFIYFYGRYICVKNLHIRLNNKGLVNINY